MPVSGQGALDKLSKFFSGFTSVRAYYAPLGDLWSDAIEAERQIQEFGVAFMSQDVPLMLSADVVTGFTGSEASLDLRGGLRSLPTVTWLSGGFLPCQPSESVLITYALGIGAGLSQLQDVRTARPGLVSSDALEATGGGFHGSLHADIGVSIQGFSIQVQTALKHHYVPSIDWKAEGKSVVPPVDWPLDLSATVGTLRVAVSLLVGSGGDDEDDVEVGEGSTGRFFGWWPGI